MYNNHYSYDEGGRGPSMEDPYNSGFTQDAHGKTGNHVGEKTKIGEWMEQARQNGFCATSCSCVMGGMSYEAASEYFNICDAESYQQLRAAYVAITQAQDVSIEDGV